jgi:hypothetical protein
VGAASAPVGLGTSILALRDVGPPRGCGHAFRQADETAPPAGPDAGRKVTPRRVRWKRGSRRSAPHRLCISFGVADTACYSGTRRTVGSRPLPVAPLHLGSPWRSGAECFRASSLGFDLARCRHDPPRTGHCAHRLGLARRTGSVRPCGGGLGADWTPGRGPQGLPRPLRSRPGSYVLIVTARKTSAWWSERVASSSVRDQSSRGRPARR